eukprot:TRINITY_DN5819_c0_g1_i1.p2 TRINITY_DN5819_c0_g1~~TRINITY_DN5819_c0_g1_i1.p2  ORF type:complete len:197 (+),score=-23.21 TRINITY_DN5819_c0_g1_i1:326-916(+)
MLYTNYFTKIIQYPLFDNYQKKYNILQKASAREINACNHSLLLQFTLFQIYSLISIINQNIREMSTYHIRNSYTPQENQNQNNPIIANTILNYLKNIYNINLQSFLTLFYLKLILPPIYLQQLHYFLFCFSFFWGGKIHKFLLTIQAKICVQSFYVYMEIYTYSPTQQISRIGTYKLKLNSKLLYINSIYVWHLCI